MIPSKRLHESYRIPKIIHLCWLSGDTFPEDIQRCIDSWKEILPEYEVWLWGKLPADRRCYEGLNIIEKKFEVDSVLWTKQAFKKRKYAFAADYIRLYALYNYGGIYLDSDVLMYKSFNDLLHLPYFVGQDYEHCFEAAVLGAEKGTLWIGEILEHYSDRAFIKEDGTLDTLPLPRIFLERLSEKYRFYRLHKLVDYAKSDTDFFIFDRDFFNSRNSCQARKTKKSYCAHNYAGTWTEKDSSLKTRIKYFMPKWLLNIFFTISHNTFNRKRVHMYEPYIVKEIK